LPEFPQNRIPRSGVVAGAIPGTEVFSATNAIICWIFQ